MTVSTTHVFDRDTGPMVVRLEGDVIVYAGQHYATLSDWTLDALLESEKDEATGTLLDYAQAYHRIPDAARAERWD